MSPASSSRHIAAGAAVVSAVAAPQTAAASDGVDAVTCTVDAPDIVPFGATAIFFNLTIAQTTGSGFLQLAPGNASIVTASTINWQSPNLSAANGSFSTLDELRQAKILSGGSGSTELIVDVTGYTIWPRHVVEGIGHSKPVASAGSMQRSDAAHYLILV